MWLYLIQNTINQKIYIGQTTYRDARRRLRGHKNDLLRNQHGNQHLQNSFNLYGVDVFTFQPLFQVNNKAELDWWECMLIKLFNSDNNNYGYNKQSGGSVGFTVATSRKRIDRLYRPVWNKGIPRTDEEKSKMSEAKRRWYKTHLHPMYGKTVPLETRQKIRQKLLGRAPTFKGHNHTEEAKRKIAVKRQGIKLSDEHKRKIGEGVRKYRQLQLENKE